jgi:hypothetical protein
VSGVGALANPTPWGSGRTALIPAPPSGTISTVGSGGDGYRAFTSPDGNVYVANHHRATNYLDCYKVSTGARCTNYPYHVPISGAFTTGSDNGTPGKPYELLNSVTNRVYLPVEKINSAPPHDVGILCADLTAETSCGFISLATFMGTSTLSNFAANDYYSFQGMGAVGNEIYVQLPNGQIGCVDVAAWARCPGEPYSNTATGVSVYGDSTIVAGTRLYSLRRTTAAYMIECFDASGHASCTNWPKTPDPPGTIGILYPLLDNTGNGMITGICAHSTAGSSGFKCYDLAGNAVSPPAGFQSWVQTYSGGWFENAGYGQPGWYKSRIFNAQRTTVSTPDVISCYDFAAASQCTGFTNVSGPNRHYATTADPQRPGCMWFYGDDGRLGSFSAIDGGPCSSHVTVAATIRPADSYCATDGKISAWDKLYLNGITVGSGITATLSIYDGNNPSNYAVDAAGNNYAKNLPVTNFPYVLPIGYGTAPGSYTSLRFELTFSGITSNAAWTQNPPPFIEVTWKGTPPELCFQTKVTGCDFPTITNQATADTTPAGAPVIHDLAPNPPFSATHTTGSDCPTKLKITKAIPGAPSGYNGTFTFNVTCALPGGSVQQQQVSITWPGTSAVITNLPAGATCSASESPVLPTLPSGYSWSPPVVVTPPNGVIVLNANGNNTISFINNIRRCNDVGAVKITKIVQGVLPGFSGTFKFNVVCWNGSSVITQTAQIAYPTPTSVTVNGIPTGSSCTVTETGPMPTLPAGWIWDSVAYSPATGQVSLVEACCPEIKVINHAKYCCPDIKTDAKE